MSYKTCVLAASVEKNTVKDMKLMIENNKYLKNRQNYYVIKTII